MLIAATFDSGPGVLGIGENARFTARIPCGVLDFLEVERKDKNEPVEVFYFLEEEENQVLSTERV